MNIVKSRDKRPLAQNPCRNAVYESDQGICQGGYAYKSFGVKPTISVRGPVICADMALENVITQMQPLFFFLAFSGVLRHAKSVHQLMVPN
jgi:hypothetical protein